MRLTAIIWLAALAHGLQAKSPKPLSVCQALENLQAYRGKVIAMRGYLRGTDEGNYLAGETCAKTLVTQGYQWRNPIPIFLIPSGSGLAETRESPGTPVLAEPGMEEAFSKIKLNPSLHVWVTYIGRLETREKFEIVLRGDGQRVPYGFGHMNCCPAQLVYAELKDIVAK